MSRADGRLGRAPHDQRHDEVFVVLAGGQIAGGMHEERPAQPLRRRQQGRAGGIVEIAPAVGGVHQRSHEAQRGDHALELARSGLARPGVHAAEPAEPFRMAREECGQLVVVEPRPIGGGPGR